MRKGLGIGLWLAVGLVWPVLGQDRPTVFNGGMRTQTVSVKPMDTSRAMKPQTLSKYPRFGPQKAMSASSFFPKLSLGNWPPKFPTPSILKGTDNPFQPNPPKGHNPFDPKK